MLFSVNVLVTEHSRDLGKCILESLFPRENFAEYITFRLGQAVPLDLQCTFFVLWSKSLQSESVPCGFGWRPESVRGSSEQPSTLLIPQASSNIALSVRKVD
jgi:hypothetical protein